MTHVPPCRVCNRTDDVICYPDDIGHTICPGCCDKSDKPTGHEFVYDKWEGWVCNHCGILRSRTEYDW